MPAVPREISIDYAGFTVGGVTDRILDGPMTIEKSYNSATVTAEVVITAATEALFSVEVNAIESAFRVPRGRLLVFANDGTGPHVLLDLNPADSTGFNAEPSIRKLGDDVDTLRTRRYEISVTAEIEADLAGQDGRRDSSVDLATDASGRRTISISGTYTTLGGVAARAQYNASIAAYQAAVLAAFGGTYELVSESANNNDNDTDLSFSRQFEEILLDQSASVTDDPEIIEQAMIVGRTKSAPGDAVLDGRAVDRLVELNVTYAAKIDKAVTDLEAKYESTIRPWIIQHTQEAAKATGAVAILDESVSLDHAASKIGATLSMSVVVGSGLLSASMSTVDAIDLGIVPVPVWSGSKHEKHLFSGPGRWLRTVTTTTREVMGGGQGTQGDAVTAGGDRLTGSRKLGGAKAGPEPAAESGGGAAEKAAADAALANGTFVAISTSATTSETRVGLSPDQIDVVDKTLIEIFLFVVPVATRGGDNDA